MSRKRRHRVADVKPSKLKKLTGKARKEAIRQLVVEQQVDARTTGPRLPWERV